MESSVALSSSWFGKRIESGRWLIDRYKALGLDRAGLSSNIPRSAAEEVVALQPYVHLKVVVLQHPFPSPEVTIRSAGLVSNDQVEREREVRGVVETLEWARTLGASVVVLEAGEVEGLQELELSLWGLFREREPRWPMARYGLEIERSNIAPAYIDNLCRSLDALLPLAEETQVGIALINRRNLRAIPDLQEASTLFHRYNSPSLSYWHDTGSGHIREVLGLESNTDAITALKHRLTGLYLNDATGVSAGRPPGTGQVDFNALLGMVPECLAVVNVDDVTLEGDLLESLSFLDGILRSQRANTA